jgi:diketogulonate reductase-like aldo/keto reductase
LRRLSTDYIDLYQLHWPNLIVPLEETMSAMEELVEQGKIRYIGVSNFLTRDLRRAQAALSRHRIVSNQVRYSLIERTIEGGLLRYCQENQITVIAYSPLGMGLQNIACMDPDDSLGKVAAQVGKTRAQVALNWCLAKEGVIAIPKADSIDHVTENCGTSGWRLSPTQMRQLDQRVRYRKRSLFERALRRAARHALQRLRRDP